MDAKQIASVEPALRQLVSVFRKCFHEPTFRHFQTYLLGLMEDMPRKNVEAIALAANVPVRTLQEFLAQFRWDHQRVHHIYQHWVADEHSCERSIGVIDASAHPKQGSKTPGVQRQYCGQSGKIDNCVLGVHLLYTNNHPTNPFSCMLGSELYVPKSWINDPDRCVDVGIPADRPFQTEWQIAVDLTSEALSNGIRFSWMTFDEAYGKVPAFLFSLDAMGLRWAGEVPANFRCWPTPPKYRSLQGPWASKYVSNVIRHSPVFTKRPWRDIKVKNTTRGSVTWRVKAARVQLVKRPLTGPGQPTDRRYWLIVAKHPGTGEVKYLVSNAPARTALRDILRAAFARWHVEKWFERGKQLSGFGCFEVRKYVGLIRHWLCSRIAMFFLARETSRLRGEKSADHLRTSRARGYAAPGEVGELLATNVA